MNIIGPKNWKRNAYYDFHWPNLAGEMRIVPMPNKEFSVDMSGPQAAVTAIAATGYNVLPQAYGDYIPRPEGFYLSCFQDPDFTEYFEKAQPNLEDWYRLLADVLFMCDSDKIKELSVQNTLLHLRHHRALQVRYKGTSHYIALVGYDTDSKEFLLREAGDFLRIPEAQLTEQFEPLAFAYGVFSKDPAGEK
ncbi:MAG: hypothetical protein HKM05_00800 [Spirochaetales bacterium]|nr:hypothetical protein [Spirochaetales bacterium]